MTNIILHLQGKKVIIDDGSLDKLPSKDEDFNLVGNGLCRGKDWAVEGKHFDLVP